MCLANTELSFGLHQFILLVNTVNKAGDSSHKVLQNSTGQGVYCSVSWSLYEFLEYILTKKLIKKKKKAKVENVFQSNAANTQRTTLHFLCKKFCAPLKTPKHLKVWKQAFK